jgi:Tol biopolymer transport system component
MAGGWLVVSPDGKVLLIATDKALHRIDRATGAATKVADGVFGTATWSRDNRLAFERYDDNNDDYIWSVAVDPATGKPTGTPRRLTLGMADTPVISPDGKLVAFAKNADAGQVVGVAPANGGPDRPLSTSPRDSRGVNPFGWSPDGQWVYYDATTGEGRGYTINRASTSGKYELLVERNVGRPSLSTDGRFIFYSPVPDSSAIATADGRLVATLQIDDRPSGVIAQNPKWLPGSMSILYTRTRRGSALTAVSLADGRSRVLGDTTARAIYPAVSPDGKSVAALTAIGGRLQVTIRPLAGGPARAIRTVDVPFEGPLVWSPDSRYVAVRTGEVVRPAGTYGAGLEVVDVAAGQSRPVTTARDVRRVDWRADGGAIRYAHPVADAEGRPTGMEIRETIVGGGDKLVRAIDANGGIVFAGYEQVYLFASGQLANLGSGATRQAVPSEAVPPPLAPGRPRPVPAVSPDLQWIAMPSATSGTRPLNAITVVSLQSGERRTIQLPFNTANPQSGLLWHPDGKHLIVSAVPSGGVSHLYLVPLSGMPPRIITTVDFSDVGITASMSPDGGTLVVSRQGAPRVELVEQSLAPLLAGATRR